MQRFLKSKWLLILLFAAIIFIVVKKIRTGNKPSESETTTKPIKAYWLAPSLVSEPIEEGEDRRQLIYGQDLIVNTSKYFGPKEAWCIVPMVCLPCLYFSIYSSCLREQRLYYFKRNDSAAAEFRHTQGSLGDKGINNISSSNLSLYNS